MEYSCTSRFTIPDDDTFLAAGGIIAEGMSSPVPTLLNLSTTASDGINNILWNRFDSLKAATLVAGSLQQSTVSVFISLDGTLRKANWNFAMDGVIDSLSVNNYAIQGVFYYLPLQQYSSQRNRWTFGSK